MTSMRRWACRPSTPIPAAKAPGPPASSGATTPLSQSPSATPAPHVNYRVVGDLARTDQVMNNTFWLGLFPALGTEHVDYVGDKLEEFFGLNF